MSVPGRRAAAPTRSVLGDALADQARARRGQWRLPGAPAELRVGGWVLREDETGALVAVHDNGTSQVVAALPGGLEQTGGTAGGDQ